VRRGAKRRGGGEDAAVIVAGREGGGVVVQTRLIQREWIEERKGGKRSRHGSNYS